MVISTSEHALQVVGGKGQHSELRLDNVLIRREGPKGSAAVAKEATLFARRFTLEGDELKAVGKVETDGIPAERRALIEALVPSEYRSRLAQ